MKNIRNAFLEIKDEQVTIGFEDFYVNPSIPVLSFKFDKEVYESADCLQDLIDFLNQQLLTIMFIEPALSDDERYSLAVELTEIITRCETC